MLVKVIVVRSRSGNCNGSGEFVTGNGSGNG